MDSPIGRRSRRLASVEDALRLRFPTAPSSSSSTASVSARFPTPRVRRRRQQHARQHRAAETAAHPYVAESRPPRVVHLRDVEPIAEPLARRPHGGSLRGEGLGHGTLGADGSRSRPRLPGVSEGFSRRPNRGIRATDRALDDRQQVVASGTAIIDELGAEHVRTGSPIVYTSADSVFQIAAHEEVIPVPELYRHLRNGLSARGGRSEESAA